MSSGIYSALSGAVAQMQRLDVISNNLANIDTVGFKQDRLRFESLLKGAVVNGGRGIDLVRVADSSPDLSQGTLRSTGNPLDVAIDGEGYLRVEGPQGVLYTRQGSLQLDGEGFLRTASGLKVLGESGPLSLPDAEVLIDEEGRIFHEGSEVGRLSLYLPGAGRLEKRGEGTFALSGGEAVEAEGARLLQGSQELSNVNPLREMAHLMETLRAFEAYQKMMKTYGNLAAKADELGSVG